MLTWFFFVKEQIRAWYWKWGNYRR